MNNKYPTLIGMCGKRRQIRCFGPFQLIYNQGSARGLWLVDNLWITSVRLAPNL